MKKGMLSWMPCGTRCFQLATLGAYLAFLTGCFQLATLGTYFKVFIDNSFLFSGFLRKYEKGYAELDATWHPLFPTGNTWRLLPGVD